ncbi:MAG: hypothetical protein JXR96_25675 [Deltaproteobacteria bacterium]|nr:hypothetical protein [Deltaproteobacteria bacterium]
MNVHIECIPCCDSDHGDDLERLLCERELLGEITLRLERALIYSSARRADDWVYVPGGLEAPGEPTWTSMEEVEALHARERAVRQAVAKAAEVSDAAAEEVGRHKRAEGFFRLSEVRAAIARWAHEIDSIDRALAQLAGHGIENAA